MLEHCGVMSNDNIWSLIVSIFLLNKSLCLFVVVVNKLVFHMQLISIRFKLYFYFVSFAPKTL